SVSGVRCWSKSTIERYRYGSFTARNGVDSSQTAYAGSEEGGDDVKSSWPLRLGLHSCYNGWFSAKRPRERQQIPNAIPTSDWSLQLDPMKSESQVIAYQQWRGEYVPGPCTHRQ